MLKPSSAALIPMTNKPFNLFSQNDLTTWKADEIREKSFTLLSKSNNATTPSFSLAQP